MADSVIEKARAIVAHHEIRNRICNCDFCDLSRALLRAVGTCAWYADADNYKSREGTLSPRAALQDQGTRARAVLAELEGEA